MARTTLTLFIDLEGAATQSPAEVADLLRQAASKADRLHDGAAWIDQEAARLIDSNGNVVGEIRVEER